MQQLESDSELFSLKNSDWTFRSFDTREYTHAYHDYPARMIPQIAEKLIRNFGKKNGLMLDPYCGSGTSLVEATRREMNPIGFDLNPLARLIAHTKTLNINEKDVLVLIDKLVTKMNKNPNGNTINSSYEVVGISDVNFWFKKDVIKKLDFIKEFISKINEPAVQDFFKLAFSETVRETSNTRIGEFKLYRYAAEKLAEYNPDPYKVVIKKLRRNLSALSQLNSFMKDLTWNESEVFDNNSCVGIHSNIIAEKTLDLIVTSPPYGDSRTTVAYGQYSRLSSAWLGFEKPEKVDNLLMGGGKKEITKLPSKKLNPVIKQISEVDPERAKEVYSFYHDLDKSIHNLSPLVKKGGYACYVVGNRTVKGFVLPTDLVVQNFFEEHSFKHIDTYIREIPNKRMPSKNSPTNETGKLASTMINEYVVVMKKV
jgi:site-specific DNA-methyltransferase (cytosine-N4-specific)